MTMGHETLDVYRLSIDWVSWVFTQAKDLDGIHRHARDQWLRASQSIPLNIAEGNGKSTEADRRRYFEIARGSALGCAAMLSKLGGRGYRLKEATATDGTDDPERGVLLRVTLAGEDWV